MIRNKGMEGCDMIGIYFKKIEGDMVTANLWHNRSLHQSHQIIRLC